MYIQGTSSLLKLITSDTPDIHVQVSYADELDGVIDFYSPNFVITSATSTTVVGSPSANHSRSVSKLFIRNAHATDPNTVTVRHYDGTNNVDILEITLEAGESIIYA